MGLAAAVVRSAPSTSATSVGTVANGASVSINCQTNGDTVTGKYGTSDIYVYTGSDGRVAPDCSGTTQVCSTSGTGDPNTCAQAVTKAKSRVHTDNDSSYDGWCDRVNAQNYGWSASDSTTAYVHWTQIPASYKHAGDREVPAGGLAFFSNGGADLHRWRAVPVERHPRRGHVHADHDRGDQEQVGPDLPRLGAAVVRGEPPGGWVPRAERGEKIKKVPEVQARR